MESYFIPQRWNVWCTGPKGVFAADICNDSWTLMHTIGPVTGVAHLESSEVPHMQLRKC